MMSFRPLMGIILFNLINKQNNNVLKEQTEFPSPNGELNRFQNTL